MHTIDGGVVSTSLKWVFGFGKGMKKTLTKEVTEKAFKCTEAWRKCIPYEFARKPRGLEYMKKWKMIEARTFLMYLMTPMFIYMGSVVRDKFALLKPLILGVHLIAGSRHIEVPLVIIYDGIYVYSYVHIFNFIY
jgi:hypothetical protein